ncbi:ABC transporter permease [Kribbella sp. NPDC004536]|uniref:ABC transporter permease n=1 Tax=Kribbella sp. NPDC004536 TaxID=3364106 RepID=UPI0036A39908
MLSIWYSITYLALDPARRFLLPPPHTVVQEGFLNGENRAELLAAFWLSARIAMAGLVVASLIGVGTAVLMSQAAWLRRSLYPYAVALQTIPILALVPLFGFWFGYGIACRVLVCVLISLFPMISNTLFGLQSLGSDAHDLFTLHRAGRLVRLWRLQLPGALPAIFVGLRTSAGLSVIGAIVGDFFFRQGDPGVGILIDLYRSRLQSEQMFAAIVLSSLLGIAVFWFFGFLMKLTIGAWYRPVEAGGRRSRPKARRHPNQLGSS